VVSAHLLQLLLEFSHFRNNKRVQVQELSVSAELAHFLFYSIVRLVQLEMADLRLNQHVNFIRNSVVGLFDRKPHFV
jgi:Ran GTPase-activating protein (RanGAP) involved in mRNA processing and transport